jgi:GDP-4-dehydro-6-deoxy-D-mannose reductase
VTTRALVTGGNGFVAQWAVAAMLDRGWVVTGAGIGVTSPQSVLTVEQRAAAIWRELDVTSADDVARIVGEAAPDVVLHLAAISHVPEAQGDPARAYEVNVLGTVRLLAELARRRAPGEPGPRVIVVGSAEQYGRHDGDGPLAETAAQRPVTLYAASKAAQEVAALQAVRGQGMRLVCTRSFNHSGPGQTPTFLLPGLVERARALPPTGGRLQIGNDAIVRDFLHVRDVVDAYLRLLDGNEVGEVYNVSSGEGVTVRALAEAVLQRLGVSAEIATDAAFARAVDVPVLIGDSSKLRRATGWAPTRTRDDIIDDLIHASTR